MRVFPFSPVNDMALGIGKTQPLMEKAYFVDAPIIRRGHRFATALFIRDEHVLSRSNSARHAFQALPENRAARPHDPGFGKQGWRARAHPRTRQRRLARCAAIARFFAVTAKAAAPTEGAAARSGRPS
jgi:hypothetical protein